jgi:hypothetical protein
MKALLFAGIIYLIVIAIVLIIKPSFMFTEDGVWKEFGIGRNPNTHTWLPFWLFAILWALISYILVTLLLSFRKSTPSLLPEEIPENDQLIELTNDDMLPVKPSKGRARARGRPTELPNGYYILNSEATDAAGGIPKYIFLGKGLPEE